MKKEINYGLAINELQKIIEDIDNDDTNLDLVVEKIKRATELIEYCHIKLRNTEIEVDAFNERLKKLE